MNYQGVVDFFQIFALAPLWWLSLSHCLISLFDKLSWYFVPVSENRDEYEEEGELDGEYYDSYYYIEDEDDENNYDEEYYPNYDNYTEEYNYGDYICK